MIYVAVIILAIVAGAEFVLLCGAYLMVRDRYAARREFLDGMRRVRT